MTFASPVPAAFASSGYAGPRMMEFVKLTSTLEAGAFAVRTLTPPKSSEGGVTIVTPSAVTLLWPPYVSTRTPVPDCPVSRMRLSRIAVAPSCTMTP